MLKRGSQFDDRSKSQVVSEYLADKRGVLKDDFEFLVHAAVAERDGSTNLNAPAIGRRDLVPDALANHLTFEVG